MEAAPHPWPTLGVLLMRDGLVTKDDLEALLSEQRDSRQQRITGRRLGELLVERRMVTQAQVSKLVAEQYELPYVELEESDIDLKVATLLSEELAKRFSAIAIGYRSDGSVQLAIADPSTVIFSDELRRVLGAPLRFAVAGPEAIDAAIEFVYHAPAAPVADAGSDDGAGELHQLGSPANAEAGDKSYFGSRRAVAHLWPPLGALLIREGLVSDAELETALAQQRLSSSRRLGEILVERGLVTTADVARLVAEQYELPFVDLSASEVEPAAAALLPEDLARQFAALPIGFLPDGSLRVVVADPTHVLYSDDLHRALGVPLSFAVGAPNAIAAAIAFTHSQARLVEKGTNETAADSEDSTYGVESEGADAVTGQESVEEPPDDSAVLRSDEELAPVSADEDLVAEEELTDLDIMDHLTGALAVLLDAEETPDEHAAGETATERALVQDDAQEAWTEATEESSVSVAGLEQGPEHETADETLAETAPVVDLAEMSFPRDTSEVTAADERPAEAGAVTAEDGLEMWTERNEASGADGEPAAESAPVVDVTEPMSTDQTLEATVADDGPELWDDAPELWTEIAGPSVPELSLVEEASETPPLPDVTDTGPADEAVEVAAVEEVLPVGEAVTDEEDPEIATDTETSEEQSAAVDRLDEALEHALSLGATAVHLSPQPGGIVVRARVDGVLRELDTIATSDHLTVTRWRQRDTLGAELSIDAVPTRHGDRVTLRVHGEQTAPPSLAGLGLTPEYEETLREAVRQPSGAILVCGPTESGKTTTLYSLLEELDSAERALTTIEDPIARVLPGVDQVEVDTLAGRTFARGLQAILRADPDVVLVGEIRDGDTAAGSLQAALSGRMVLAGLHAQSAAAAVQRLVDLGVQPGLLGTTLTCVVAQRLLRRVCRDCRETYYATEEELAGLGRITTDVGPRLLARGRGCAACGETGFRGRAGVFEILPLTDDIRALVAGGASTTEIHEAAVATGMRTLRDDGVRLCLEGVTTAAEVQRVTGTGDNRG